MTQKMADLLLLVSTRTSGDRHEKLNRLNEGSAIVIGVAVGVTIGVTTSWWAGIVCGFAMGAAMFVAGRRT